MHKPMVMSGGRYPVLRALALLYLIGAGLAAIAGVIGVGYVLATVTDTIAGKLLAAAGVAAATFFLVITMLAIAEVLKLFMDIEHNSRGMSNVMVATSGSNVAISSGHTNRVSQLDEETAEGALLRGH
jgi:hypothetical protein